MDKDNNNVQPEADLDYSPDLITLTDEEGNQHNFELVDSLEHKGSDYVALIVEHDNADDMLEGDGDLVIMKIVQDGDEEVLELIEDDDEFTEVSEVFMERLADLYEFDELEDEEQ